MDGEQANQNSDQSNETYSVWQNMADEVMGAKENNQILKPQEEELADTNTEASGTDRSEDYELTPEQVEWREGHTDEECDQLANEWDNWMQNDGCIGINQAKILEDISHDKELGWKFSDFETFFENSWEVNFLSKEDRDYRSVGHYLGTSLKILKQAMGEESPVYESAAKKILIDIRDGKYKGARMSYDDRVHTKIIFGDDKDSIEHDDQRRKEKEEEKERRREEEKRKREEAWEKSWRNPRNQAAYDKNLKTMDRRTSDYLSKLLYNLGKLAPEAKESAMSAINQKILEGSLNRAYLSDDGYIWTGELAEEFRGYDQKKHDGRDHDEDKPQIPSIIKPNKGHSSPEEKTPEELGFRDW